MARSRSRSTRSQSGARSSGRRPGATVEEAEDAGGMDIDAGMALVTTVLLLAAILFLDYELGTHYGGGMFFK